VNSAHKLVHRLIIFAVLPAWTAPPVAAQITSDRDPSAWTFFFNLGAGGISGDLGGALENPRTGEFGLRRTSAAWRYGFGVNFGSMALKAPFNDELEWGYQRLFASVDRRFSTEGSLRPTLGLQAGAIRMHPRSELFELDPLPPDFSIGDSPTPPSNGVFLGLVPGLEWRVSPAVAVETSLLAAWHAMSEVDLSPIGRPAATSGTDWQLRLGLSWRTARSDNLNPWGIPTSWGWALGEAAAINFGASALNEYVRNANFNQISPRSWWSNVADGFTYDDNEFLTNQYIHPFNGSQYFNAARSNGLGFWSSYAIALGGALQWELAGETHPMSFNDLVSTGVGGAALGETMYRLSSMVLDNEATGSSRLFREASAFFLDPIRGFNRVVTGRAWDVRPNPADAADTNPIRQRNELNIGWRRLGENASLGRNSSDFGFAEYFHEHGDLFTAERHGPFDFFTVDAQLNFGDKRLIGRAMIAGNWFSVPVTSSLGHHRIGITQHFQYINNQAYEYGGQSLGPSFFSRWGSLGDFGLESRFDLLATILGGVNSEAASLADVADPERLREYDYGPGAGGVAQAVLTYRQRPLLSVDYRLHYIATVNGSIYHKDGEPGLDSHHWLHGIDAHLELPIAHDLGLGLRYSTFNRESHYDVSVPGQLPAGATLSQLIEQSNPELRIYVSYLPSVR